MRDPEFIAIKAKEITVPNTEQYYFQVHEKQKFDVLCRLLDLQSPDAAIVFGRTKRRVDELYDALTKRGYSAEAIHGDLAQARRDSVMRKFKKGITEILVATDVAARGLDISTVTHVFNFDIPQDPDSYVHRIGRTGRLGKPGIASTFVTHREISHLELIERAIKKKIIRKPVPTISETFEGQQRLTAEKLLQAVEEAENQQYTELARKLLENTDALSLLAAALKMLTKEPDLTPVEITAEEPKISKKNKFEKKRGRADGFRKKPVRAKREGGY